MALLYFVDTIIHYIRHKSKHFNPHFFKTTNQSLTNLKNPTTGAKGILVNDGSTLTEDYLLVYTIQSTEALYSGGYIDINGIRVAQLTAQRTNCALTIVGSVRGFKGDVLSVNTSSFGGSISVYAYNAPDI